jgi:N-acyl-D-amino-acid deacylase
MSALPGHIASWTRCDAARLAETRVAIREMLTHPAGVVGPSDRGAQCFMISDATTRVFADPLGAGPPRRREVGKRADVNVIDLDTLTLQPARMA